MPVMIWEVPVAIYKRYWLAQLVLIIYIWLVPNIGSVLKGVLEVEDVQIGIVLRLETTNIVVVLEVIVLEFEVTEVVQDIRQLVIGMIPEPTSLLYWISTITSTCNELLLLAVSVWVKPEPNKKMIRSIEWITTILRNEISNWIRNKKKLLSLI